MKVLKALILTLAIAVTAIQNSTAAILDSEIVNKNMESKPVSSTCTKAILKNGIVIPHVTLPVVTISAKRPVKNALPAVKSGNQYLPVVNLPEVIITAPVPCEKLYAAVIKQNQVIAVINLPVVEITAQAGENNFISEVNYSGLKSNLIGNFAGDKSVFILCCSEAVLNRMLDIIKEAGMKKLYFR